MLELLFATANKGKLLEAKELAAPFQVRIVSPDELGLGELPEVDETGSTYRENAQLKSDAAFSWSKGHPVFADDSGLEVDALGGAPGLYSARYAGKGCKPGDNRTKLLTALAGVKDRGARMRCVLCLKMSPGSVAFFEGVIECSIGEVERGEAGFGYDPLIIPAGYRGLTLAELKAQGTLVKTHRFLALEALCRAPRI